MVRPQFVGEERRYGAAACRCRSAVFYNFGATSAASAFASATAWALESALIT